jgi:lipopolysaccharide biosynthesis glycosyltransferase
MQTIQAFLETAMLIISLVGIIYKVSQTETKLYILIDSVKDTLMKAINQINLRFQVHLQDYVKRNEMVDFKIKSLGEKIDRIEK